MTDRKVTMAAEQGPFLLLNTKEIVSRLHEWFPDAARELVVVTTRADIPTADLDAYAERFLHLEVVPSLWELPDAQLADLARRFGVRRILSLGEREVLRAARLRAELGLPGQSLASATAYRDKHVMKTTLAAAGLDVAPMRAFRTNDELAEFAWKVGFPVVVKELDSGASNGTSVLMDEDALSALPERPDGATRLAEAWVEGDFYHVNGLMKDGEAVLAVPSRNLYSDWFSVAFDAPTMTGMMPDEDPLSERLRDTARQVVAALPAVPGLCAFHLELFHTADDRLVVCEIASRAGAALVTDVHEAVLGMNFYGASLLGQAGRGDQVEIRPTGERLGFVWFPPAQGVLRALPDTCPLPGTVTYRARGDIGRRYGSAPGLGLPVAEMVFRLTGPDTGAELRRIEEWWDDNVVWEHRTNAVPDRWKTPRRKPADA
ncbi:ATP-grasp domain-containing protein [Streptomyces niveiscabiei]|uniref:ATP-grasp domain-containing protein n=1 Tax=Streptomyces niveiscabiei TaxID=164115 RepID=A0ABW9I5G5_9ACTN